MSETPSEIADVSPPESLTSMLPEVVRARYKVEAELGRGNMGVVYRAHDRRLARPAAIKELYSVMARGDAKARAEARFLREARLSARLSHPNVITIFDILHAEERWFLVMELLEGQTLRQILRERERVSPSQARAWIVQAARGLDAAHRAGIIHRDIKPENLMLVSGGWVKLMDFGIALSADSSRLTGAGGTMGTPAYLAPELLHGALPDARTDLFALGVVLYELLMGHNPYSGGTVTQVLMRVAQTQALSLQQNKQGIPRDLDRILMRLTAPEPDRRYASAAELVEDLEKAAIDPGEALEESEDQVTLSGNHAEDVSRRTSLISGWTMKVPVALRAGAALCLAGALGGFLALRAPVREPSDHPLALARGAQVAPIPALPAGETGSAVAGQPLLQDGRLTAAGQPAPASPPLTSLSGAAPSVSGASPFLPGAASPPSAAPAVRDPGGPRAAGEVRSAGSEYLAASSYAPGTGGAAPVGLTAIASPPLAAPPLPTASQEARAQTQRQLERARACTHRKGGQAGMRCLETTLPGLPAEVEAPREARQLLVSLMNQDALLERGLNLAPKALPKDEYASILEKLLKSPDSARRWAAAPRLRKLGVRVEDATLYRRDLEDSSCQVRRDAAQYFVDHPTPAARADLERAFRQSETVTVKPADLFHGRLLGKKVEERTQHCDYDALKLALDGLKTR